MRGKKVMHIGVLTQKGPNRTPLSIKNTHELMPMRAEKVQMKKLAY